jgi:hypothetical protein
MSLIAYLCWLLGIATPSECDANDYESFLMGSCTSEEGSVETPSQKGEEQHPQRHSQRTNIDVSI